LSGSESSRGDRRGRVCGSSAPSPQWPEGFDRGDNILFGLGRPSGFWQLGMGRCVSARRRISSDIATPLPAGADRRGSPLAARHNGGRRSRVWVSRLDGSLGGRARRRVPTTTVSCGTGWCRPTGSRAGQTVAVADRFEGRGDSPEAGSSLYAAAATTPPVAWETVERAGSPGRSPCRPR